LLVFVKDW